MPTDPPKIVILASGQGSLAAAVMASAGVYEVAAIISDQPAAGVLGHGNAVSIPTVVVELQGDRPAWEERLSDAVAFFSPQLVVSAGFMRILSPRFLQRFRVINSHPSLLPLFPGAHAVRDALLAGVSLTGCTIHWVDEGVDTGEVIAQRIVEVLPGDTEATLHERIKVVERELLVSVVEALVKGN
jgi:phosphoribosylglycinamide formyltransferase-1